MHLWKSEACFRQKKRLTYANMFAGGSVGVWEGGGDGGEHVRFAFAVKRLVGLRRSFARRLASFAKAVPALCTLRDTCQSECKAAAQVCYGSLTAEGPFCTAIELTPGHYTSGSPLFR